MLRAGINTCCEIFFLSFACVSAKVYIFSTKLHVYGFKKSKQTKANAPDAAIQNFLNYLFCLVRLNYFSDRFQVIKV
jgi:hypothetical protein